MRRSALLISGGYAVLVVCLAGCSDSTSVEIEPNDYEMTLAMIEARDTVDEFLAVLRNPGPNQTGFAVKIGLTEGERTDYVWLTQVRLDGDRLTGTLAGDPPYVDSAEKGEQRSVAPREIVDWAYFDDGQRIGARTDAILERRAKE